MNFSENDRASGQSSRFGRISRPYPSIHAISHATHANSRSKKGDLLVVNWEKLNF